MTLRKAFLKVYGPLSFPVTVLALNGWFAFPQKPISIKGIFITLYAIVHYLFVIITISAFLISNVGYIRFDRLIKDLDWIFLYQFFPTVLILSTLHMRMLLKKDCNTGKLIMDLHAFRKNKLKLRNKIPMCIIALSTSSTLIWILLIYLNQIQEVFHTGTYTTIIINFGGNIKSNGVMAATVLAIVELIFLFISVWIFILFNSIFIAFICMIIGNEYEEFANQVENTIYGLNDKSVFLEVKQRFQDLSQLVFKVENHFRLYIGISLTTSIILDCIALYVVISKFKCQDFSSTLYWWVAPMTIIFSNILLLTIPVASLNSKALSVVNTVMKWNANNTDSSLLLQVSAFFQQFSPTSIGLTVGGIVTITKDSVLTMFGTMLAYVIIVIQFGQDHENDCISYTSAPVQHNVTNITIPFN